MAAIAEKLCMMPQTVPNSPMNGAVAPTEATHGHGDGAIDTFAHAGPTDISARDSRGTPPFPHRGPEHGGDRMRRADAFLVVELFEAAAGPETVFERVGLLVDLAQARPFLEHHGPNPDRSRK
jgi:hypothetical protein